MALNKQVHLYNFDTSAFYNDKEHNLYKRLSKLYLFRTKLNKKKKKKNISEEERQRLILCISRVNKHINKKKDQLLELLKANKYIRELRKECVNDRNIISIFESTLTRTIGIPTDTLSDEIMVIRTYYFEVLKDLILQGFIYNGERYVYFTSSAGQIRTKKSVFIRESTLLKHQKSLMCGLTVSIINKLGGVNINKYLAYLALCNSATELWEDFDIDRAIVVDDMETMVNGVVDFINDKDYSITRQRMDVPIEHTDGCGMMLPKVKDKSMMVRLPWLKGLLTPFPFDEFIREHNGSSKVTDIYGKEWDIFKDNIEIIFTKSQFKMWRFYSSWEEYKENFKKFNCQAGTCNEEQDEFDNAKISYQMLQTLTDMTDEELEYLCRKAKSYIINIGSNRSAMLRVLGVTNANTNKNYLQQAIEIYPELLNDIYCREVLRQVKKSLVKEARSGRFEINGTYTFLIPDLYAFCEYLFLKNKNPKGLLKDGEVFCRLYDDVDKLDCLRSPHLYREHAVRKNVVDDKKKKWFTTNGLYTSCHDLISKLLMFDNDGDTSLVVVDKRFVEIAERHMQDIVPLYYNMANAGVEQITPEAMYNGLIAAYTGGNIGVISNDITKIWNSDNVNLDIIKWLCAENNFVIDYAKTLYKPQRPKHINTIIRRYTKSKVPHFFIYAKNKGKDNVAKLNDSLVNRLEYIIPNPNINFKAVGLANFDYKMLMLDKEVDIATPQAQDIIEKYNELDLKKFFIFNKDKDNNDHNNYAYQYKKIRDKILEIDDDINYVTDVLIMYLYGECSSRYKTTLWESFGDVIVENLKNNISGDLIYCERCGDLIETTSNRQKYCSECAREVWEERNRVHNRERMRRLRSKKQNVYNLEKSP